VEPDAPVLRLVNLQRLWLELHLAQGPETRERTVRTGMPARLTGGADAIIGRVTAVAPMVEPETQTFLVRIELQRGTPLALGAFVSAELLDTSTAGGRWRIPAGALIRDATGTRVFLRRGDTLTVQAVDLVGESAEHAWVTGLAGEDLVVTQGLAALRALWAEPGSGS
jgi:multidrug efflux pump subunit AcrA (membrane-fusion protein)